MSLPPRPAALAPGALLGPVALVGAGPGDPGLLTLHARDRLARADVVVHDALVSPEILALLPPDVERVDVGKRRGKHVAEQDEIHAVLIAHARAGRRVVRLKGGDPFLFGRGGEEAEALAAAGIPCEVIPGVSSAIAGPASIGIPVTHRDLAASVTVVTGHECADPTRDPLKWRAMAESAQTLVILMGLAHLRAITGALVSGGRAADTPVAIVHEATTPRQRHVVGTLETVADLAEAAGIHAPAIVVVGPVAALAARSTPQAQSPCAQNATSVTSFSPHDRDAVYRAIHSRRDTRAFRPDPVNDAVLQRILEAAHHAPSVGLTQPWDFVVVADRAIKHAAYTHACEVAAAEGDLYEGDQRATYRGLKLQGLLDAPLGVVVTCDPTRGGTTGLGRSVMPDTPLYSTCLAIQNLWLAARAEGVGVGWVSILRPERVRALLGIPDHVQVVAWLTLGWPVELPEEPVLQRVGWRARLPLAQVVHREGWGLGRREAAPPHEHPDPAPAPTPIPTAAARNADLTKPPGSLGRLETEALRIARVQGTAWPRASRRTLLLCAGDHGVTNEGVSAYQPHVTARMVLQFAAGAGAVNVFARAGGVEVRVADLGVDHDFAGATGIVHAKVRRATRNFVHGPAMTAEETASARAAGRRLVASLGPVDLLGLGEMGIGNSTSAAALVAAILRVDAAEVVGRGTGVGALTLLRKAEVVRRGVARHVDADPLASLGGYEIAALVGAMEEAALRRIPVVLDGFITGAAALYAVERCGVPVDGLVAGHLSAEHGHKRVLDVLGLRPLLDVGLRLGEGTGAVLAMGLLDAACRTFTEMRTFEEAGLTDAAVPEARC
ncbi:MAG: nicotinate-nucleotide--dimethylbenzimidazole phosphoribosyltransferase [Pseudomonadota bacterium]|nr:nicotinate-nucleotide--dimethylbenzimidazole phosphoribosyltransferase [Pseudomonadota bacterium]